MARTNTITRNASLTTHEGGKAVAINAKEQLLRTTASCMLFENTFYEGGESIAKRLTDLVAQNDVNYVGYVALTGRNELKLRHAPLWLAVNSAMIHRGTIARNTVAKVIQRPDELAEAIAMYFRLSGREAQKGNTKLPASLKKGIADAFPKFSEYSLAKWNRLDREVKLKDALFLSHPKPKDAEQDALWKRLVAGSLATPDTWEVALSTGKDKKETWTRLITEDKLGDMAILMNLRNMTSVGVERAIVRQAIASIGPKSRLLPFRFVAAARFAPEYADELEQAMYRVIKNFGKLKGTTVLVLDNSGSMHGAPISEKSKLDRSDAAGALAVLIREVCEDARVFGYGSSVEELPNRRGLALIDAYKGGPGGGTNTAEALTFAKKKVPSAARVILVTDEQAHDGIISSWGEQKGYVVNVAPYAPGLDTSGNWQRINGWSDRLLDWVSFEETGHLLVADAEESAEDLQAD